MDYLMSDWLGHTGYKEIILKATMTPNFFLHYGPFMSQKFGFDIYIHCPKLMSLLCETTRSFSQPDKPYLQRNLT